MTLAAIALTIAACGDDDAAGPDAAPGPDASQPADAATTSDAAPLDANALDASAPDGRPPDAAPTPPMLYAIVANRLVTIDTATGDATDIGATGLTVTRSVYDPSSDTVFGIYDNTSAPKIATIDVCTGAATHLVNMSLPGNFVDGLSFDPVSGQLYAAVSANGSFPSDGSAEHLVTVDTATGTTTTVGDFTGGLLDGDTLLLELAQPIAIDGDSGAQTIDIFNVDPSTAVTSNARSAGPPRSGRHAVFGGIVYALGMSGAIAGQIVTMNPADGAVTPVGGAHVVSQFATMFSAPVCSAL